MFQAKPQVSRCGLITLTQIHRNTPIVGRQTTNGSEPNKNPARMRSLMVFQYRKAQSAYLVHPVCKVLRALRSVLSESAQFAHVPQCDQVRQRVDPFPLQSKRFGLRVEFSNIDGERGKPPGLQTRAQQLKLQAPAPVPERALPVDLPVRQAGGGKRLELECGIRAGNDAPVVPTPVFGSQVPLDERADQAVVALKLERDAHRLRAQALNEAAAQRVQVRHQLVIVEDFLAV